MKPFRIAMAALAWAGCSGPYELMNPSPEPDATATPPGPLGTGASPDCVREGGEIPAASGAPAGGATSGAAATAECCPGLTRVGTFKGSILRLDACEPAGDGRAFCVRCGDGKCGVAENFCTCKADCEWPRVDPE
jgi:hypothetical protein